VNLIENEADLIIVARTPSEDELDLAHTNGVDLVVKPIALDAFVFILNKDNPLESLTLDQIKDIYTGDITHWSEVEGEDYIINTYQRNDNSGSQELMETLVMKDEEMVDAPEMILYGMMGPINALSVDAYGIGYSVYYYEQFMAPNENIKLCGVDEVIPSRNTISSEEYAFVTGVYAVIRADTTDVDNASHLRDWLLTDEGQSVIEESGYIPI
jgi:phosphate transport system substrate-binding protein